MGNKKSRAESNVNTKYIKILASFFIVVLSASGAWAMSDGDNVFDSPGTTGNYDAAKTLPRTPRAVRTGSASGTETDVSVWTYSSINDSKLALGIESRGRVPTNLLHPLFGQYY
jgi:hypothetical protein